MAMLRRSGKKYNKRRSNKAGRGCIPNRVRIEERPEIVEKKSRLGDWELDTIIGKGHQGAIVSIVDRASESLIKDLLRLKWRVCHSPSQPREGIFYFNLTHQCKRHF